MYLCCSGDAGQGRSGGEGGGPHGHGHESSLLRNGVVGKCAESVDLKRFATRSVDVVFSLLSFPLGVSSELKLLVYSKILKCQLCVLKNAIEYPMNLRHIKPERASGLNL